MCVFSDASAKAVAAVAYIKVTDAAVNKHVGFVMGKAKLAPQPEHTIPRLELCAAVLAVELADLISAELDLQLDDIIYYSDSKVVLGYICNKPGAFTSMSITGYYASKDPPIQTSGIMCH